MQHCLKKPTILWFGGIPLEKGKMSHKILPKRTFVFGFKFTKSTQSHHLTLFIDGCTRLKPEESDFSSIIELFTLKNLSCAPYRPS